MHTRTVGSQQKTLKVILRHCSGRKHACVWVIRDSERCRGRLRLSPRYSADSEDLSRNGVCIVQVRVFLGPGTCSVEGLGSGVVPSSMVMRVSVTLVMPSSRSMFRGGGSVSASEREVSGAKFSGRVQRGGGGVFMLDEYRRGGRCLLRGHPAGIHVFCVPDGAADAGWPENSGGSWGVGGGKDQLQ